VAAGHRLVEELGGAVEPPRILQLGQLEQELGPFGLRRQVVLREGVDVRGVARHLRSSLAMMIFCTSVAPS
jgi:hypothetical protein